MNYLASQIPARSNRLGSVPFINTLLQQGVARIRSLGNRFNGFLLLTLLSCVLPLRAQEMTGTIPREIGLGREKPIFLNLTGISGEAASTLQFDLYVQGFAFTNSDGAQYLISGDSTGNLEARAKDKFTGQTLVNKAYSGANLRRQVHAFADDFVQALGRKPICQTRIAFKAGSGMHSEICIADFDGHNVQAVTADNTLVAAPCWVPGRMAIYYTSYKFNHPDIFYQNLITRDRKVFARYGGSNMSPAPSPDGNSVAMILSKDGWTDLYVVGANGGEPLRLTKSQQDESSPCWTADGKYIIFASKDRERRALRKVPATGGTAQAIPLGYIPNPTEPDCSPDGKLLALTSQTGGFSICAAKIDGSDATVLVEGEDPSWAPNSRTLIFARRQGGNYVLSLLDVPTKQVKTITRISGSNSQSQPSWAR